MAHKILRRDGPLAVVASLALALLLLAGVAKFCNSLLDRRADAFLAGDVDTLERPLRAKSIGLASLGALPWSKGETRCDEFCQRLLLCGAVERVVVADLNTGDTDWTAETPALAYRLEERESCPPIHVANRRYGRPVDDATPEEAMRVTVASPMLRSWWGTVPNCERSDPNSNSDLLIAFVEVGVFFDPSPAPLLAPVANRVRVHSKRCE